MSGKGSPSNNGNGTDSNSGDGIDTALLEKRLEGLRDTQESVQGLSLWCQANKRHSQIIVETWLRILRKSPVEKRLTMFYLANDVVQHAKRKADVEIVNQWAFAVQKATPHVRTPSSVSNAIGRIFKIWEERGVYSKDAVADLLSLLNNVSSKEKVEKKRPETYTANAEKVAAFQPTKLISKIKSAYHLKSHLGTTFRTKSYCQMDMETLKISIKDRQHGQDVIQEMGTLVEQLRTSEMKLQAEVEERRKIVETGETAIVFYENVRSESKIVNAAYKNFTNRVLKAHDAVDNKLRSFEEMEKEPSPCPSPPAAAPSPTEDDDIHLDSRHTIPYESNNPIEVVKSSNQIEPPEVSPSNSVMSRGEMNSYMPPSAPTTPAPPPHSHIQHPVVSNMAMQMPYNPQQPLGGGFDQMGLDFQQLQNWSAVSENFAAAMMNFSSHQSITPQQPPPQQNFGLTPSMQLQMQMQQQSLQQAYGFPGKYDQPDVSAIPLPPSNPPMSNPPPLPPPDSLSHYPPLPPQPHNPPLPEMPVYQQQHQQQQHQQQSSQQIENVPPYAPDNTKPVNTMFPPPGNKYQDNMYQSQSMQDSESEYIPTNMPSENIFSQQNIQPIEESYQSKMQSPQYQPHGSQQVDDQLGEYRPSSRPSQENSHFEQPREHSSSSDFDFDYESDMIDSSHQTNYEAQKHQYSPPKYHPYNPSPRTRRPNSRAPGPRNLQPLLASPNINPRFQPRTPNAPMRPQGERFSAPSKIPSLLEGPTSPNMTSNKPLFRHGTGFEGYSSFEDNNTPIMGTNGGSNESNFRFDNNNFQSPNPFEDNSPPVNMLGMNLNQNMNPRPRGPGRGFRGGFRGSPRMRGNGPGGPRRGRF